MSEIIHTNAAPAPIGPYSQAVKAGNMVFCSGQIALDPSTGMLRMENIEVETRQVLENLKALLNAAGAEMKHVVKCSIFLSDMNQFAEVNAVYAEYFGASCPARETVEVACLPKKVNVEISAIAVLD